MIKRTLYFGNPAYLSLNSAQLIVRLPQVEKNNTLGELFKKEAQASIPVEDIGIIVLDHKQLTLTNALLDALLQNNVAVITCNSTHHPLGLLLPLQSNTIQNERYRAQLDASEPLKKQLWQHTVVQKIKNQAAVLEQNKLHTGALFPLWQNVKSGDSGNCEATAASIYWSSLGVKLTNGNGAALFRRHREGIAPNNYLNYGYALLRATMARSIVGAGLLPTLGIHHANRYNAYCLADDLMEPYRPYVDKLVLHIVHAHGLVDDLPKEIKATLLQIPVMDVMLDGEKSPLMNATQRTAVSIVKCFTGELRKPLYPVLE